MHETFSYRLPAVLRSDTHPVAAAELNLAETARRVSDFARGMVPSGHPIELEPGELARDALRLVEHANQVLIAAIRHEGSRGTSQSLLDSTLGAGATVVGEALRCATNPRVLVWTAEVVTDTLFDLDAWVHRHAEIDDPQASRQPVTDVVTSHLADR